MDISLLDAVNILVKANSIIITTHINPDGDALGSILGLYYHLTKRGKVVSMLLADEIAEQYSFLGNIDKIQGLPEAKLTADLLVVLDASDIERIGTVNAYVSAPILNIDHHISNTRYADYCYVDSNAVATGEIILDLLRLEAVKIDYELAKCLYTAIATDCGFFRYANTTPKIMRDAADLIDAGVRPEIICEALESKPVSSIITLQKTLETLELAADGRVAAVTVYCQLIDKKYNTEGLINIPRNIKGVEIAILFKVVDENNTRISFRSRSLDVSKLALSFGGGGHVKAAGCTIQGSPSVVKNNILAVCEELLREAE